MMPCYDNMDADYDAKLMKRRLDRATRLLCEVIRHSAETHGDARVFIGTQEMDAALQKELDAWWTEHKELDSGT